MNIRSISRNFDEFVVLLNCLSSAFDIIVLTETFHITNLEIFSIGGYQAIYSGGTLNKNDGVVVYLKKDLKYTHKTITLGESKSLEINIINKGCLTLTAVYRSPQTCVDTFNKDLFAYLEKTHQIETQVLVGDMNINLLSDSDFVEEYKNILCTFGFMSMINEYTRPAGKRCIDHIFLKKYNLENVLDDIKDITLSYN